MKRISQILFLMCSLALLLSGCGSMQPTGYLNDYGRLESGNNLEKVWHEPSLRMESSSILVKEINTEHISDAKGVSVTDAVEWMKSALNYYSKVHGLNFAYDVNETQYKYELDLAITKMTPGSSSARFWAAEFGAGHAMVQIEGKVTNQNSNPIMTFSDLRQNSGALGFKDIGGNAGPQLVHESIKELAEAIVLELKHYIR
jgi:hypothetical protein